jgi:hypothetical protein
MQSSLVSGSHRALPVWRRLIISHGGYLKGYSSPKQTTSHIDALKANITEDIQSVTAERTGKDFPKYGAPGSILSGRKMVATSSTCYDVVTFLTQ